MTNPSKPRYRKTPTSAQRYKWEHDKCPSCGGMKGLRSKTCAQCKAGFRLSIEQPEDLTIRYIPLNHGKFTIVDASDYDFLNQWRWRAWQSPDSKLWYAVRTEKYPGGGYGMVYMHRRIMGLERGDQPTVDHRKTAETLNNRRSNLRFAGMDGQGRNQRTPKDNTSGVKGVGWEEDRKLFRAVITVNYKQIFLGRRKTIEEAAALYRAGQIKYHGEFANFD